MESEIYKGIPYSVGEIRLFIEHRRRESAPQPWYDYIEFLLQKIDNDEGGALADIGMGLCKECNSTEAD